MREWITSRYPDSPVLDIAFHADESQFHVHALSFPRGRTADGELRLGMTAASMAADALTTGRLVNGRWGKEAKKEAASRLQDDAWLRVGEPHGLMRGKRTAGRKHKALTKEKRAEAVLNEAADRADGIVRNATSKANELTDGAEVNFTEAERDRAEAAKLLKSQRGLLAKRRIAKVEKREAAADERDRLLNDREAKLRRFVDAIRKETKALITKTGERGSAWWQRKERELEGIESDREPEITQCDPVPKHESAADELKRRVREGLKR